MIIVGPTSPISHKIEHCKNYSVTITLFGVNIVAVTMTMPQCSLQIESRSLRSFYGEDTTLTIIILRTLHQGCIV